MHINIRIDEGLYKEIRESAKKHYRTITGELNVLLMKALGKDVSFVEEKEKEDIYDKWN